MRQYYFIRHGEQQHQKIHILDIPTFIEATRGGFNESLTEKGELQAKKLAAFLEQEEIEVLFSSELKRAKQTADIAAENAGGIPIRKRFKELNEVIIGESVEINKVWWRRILSNRVPKFIRRNLTNILAPIFKLWLVKQWLNGNTINGDQLPEVEKRLHNVLLELDTQPEQRIGIVCHGWIIMLLVRMLFGLSLRKAASAIFKLKHTSVTRIDTDEKGKRYLRYFAYVHKEK